MSDSSISGSSATLHDLLAGLRELLHALDGEVVEAAPQATSGKNYRCEGCVDCEQCRFCTDCKSCIDCTYCENCEACTSCTQSRFSVECSASTYLESCQGCTNSRYLTLSLDCDSCVHCLACVGLQDEEFCILNRRYPRKTYFEIVRSIQDELVKAREQGQMPTLPKRAANRSAIRASVSAEILESIQEAELESRAHSSRARDHSDRASFSQESAQSQTSESARREDRANAPATSSRSSTSRLRDSEVSSTGEVQEVDLSDLEERDPSFQKTRPPGVESSTDKRSPSLRIRRKSGVARGGGGLTRGRPPR